MVDALGDSESLGWESWEMGSASAFPAINIFGLSCIDFHSRCSAGQCGVQSPLQTQPSGVAQGGVGSRQWAAGAGTRPARSCRGTQGTASAALPLTHGAGWPGWGLVERGINPRWARHWARVGLPAGRVDGPGWWADSARAERVS
jgi:hypothetical protein